MYLIRRQYPLSYHPASIWPVCDEGKQEVGGDECSAAPRLSMYRFCVLQIRDQRTNLPLESQEIVSYLKMAVYSTTLDILTTHMNPYC